MKESSNGRKEVDTPDPTQKIIKAIQAHGKSLGRLIASSNKASERLTKSIIYLTWAIFLFALIQFLINLLPTQPSPWVTIVSLAIVLILMCICVVRSVELSRG